MPENVNINAYGGAGLASASPTPFQAWENACEGRLALTNEMWGLKMNTMTQMYDHRQTDIAEKFSIWKSQVDADFGLYKSNRDSYDAISDKLNAATFGLYKEQRDNYDKMAARLGELETRVAVGAAIRGLYGSWYANMTKIEYGLAWKNPIRTRWTCIWLSVHWQRI